MSGAITSRLQPYQSLIEAKATKYDLDWRLIAAICYQESRFNPFAMRYEATLTDKYLIQPRDFASHLGITYDTEYVCQRSSFGMMQVMGFVAREHGFKLELTRLFELDTGLEYGCIHLRSLSRRYPDESDLIASYNAGSPRKTKGGMYVNQSSYVDPVSRTLRELRGEI